MSEQTPDQDTDQILLQRLSDYETRLLKIERQSQPLWLYILIIGFLLSLYLWISC